MQTISQMLSEYSFYARSNPLDLVTRSVLHPVLYLIDIPTRSEFLILSTPFCPSVLRLLRFFFAQFRLTFPTESEGFNKGALPEMICPLETIGGRIATGAARIGGGIRIERKVFSLFWGWGWVAIPSSIVPVLPKCEVA